MSDRTRLLELALKGLEAERTEIDGEIAEIKRELNPRAVPDKVSDSANTMTSTIPKTKRVMSAAARKKISEAMKRRYAEKAKAAKKAS